jgi:putative transposase
MSKSRHTEAQMIGALKQLEAGRKAEDVARVGVSKHTIYAWKAKYGGMDVSQAQEAKQLRDENTKLRKLVADLSLDKEALQSVIRKNGWRWSRTELSYSYVNEIRGQVMARVLGVEEYQTPWD